MDHWTIPSPMSDLLRLVLQAIAGEDADVSRFFSTAKTYPSADGEGWQPHHNGVVLAKAATKIAGVEAVAAAKAQMERVQLGAEQQVEPPQGEPTEPGHNQRVLAPREGTSVGSEAVSQPEEQEAPVQELERDFEAEMQQRMQQMEQEECHPVFEAENGGEPSTQEEREFVKQVFENNGDEHRFLI
jgi:hypothetical protein